MSLKKKKSGKGKFTLAKGHKARFEAAHPLQAGIDVFGQVIDPPIISDLPEGQQLSRVYGFREQGRCVRLPVAKYLSLPKPDGPADGCGWDPSQFVVWRDLPKDLITTRVETRKVTIHDAVATVQAAAIISEPTVDDVLHQWLSNSVAGQPIPDVDQLQVAWAAFGSGGAFSVQVQQNLANLLNREFSLRPAIVAANLPATLTIAQLKLTLHRSA